MRQTIICLLLFLSACGGGGNTPAPPNPQPPISGWTQFYGGLFTPPNFNFPPAPGSVHYVVEPGKAALGQTVTLVFQISGSGTWGISDTTDTLPPTIHLFLWENGDPGTGQGDYETYREWAGRTVITNPGQYTISVKLDPANWTGVFGQTPSADAFQQLLNNLYGVGFTFGGASFAGHGVYSATGSFHFQLVSYSIN